MLVFPASALAQGAGDDQYQDPFGDQQAQTGGGSGSSDDGGLSDSPPVKNGSGSNSGSGSSGSSGSGSTGAGSTGTPAPAPSTGTAPSTSAEATGRLPHTGSDPRILVVLGASMILGGIGLRLRTIDPDAY
jgi:LPXTG-motif cell wall-anchored protein